MLPICEVSWNHILPYCPHEEETQGWTVGNKGKLKSSVFVVVAMPTCCVVTLYCSKCLEGFLYILFFSMKSSLNFALWRKSKDFYYAKAELSCHTPYIVPSPHVEEDSFHVAEWKHLKARGWMCVFAQEGRGREIGRVLSGASWCFSRGAYREWRKKGLTISSPWFHRKRRGYGISDGGICEEDNCLKYMQVLLAQMGNWVDLRPSICQHCYTRFHILSQDR